MVISPGNRDNSLIEDLHCSITGDVFSLTGDIGPLTGMLTSMFIVGLTRVLHTFFAVCSQEMLFFCHKNGYILHLMKIHIKISENHNVNKIV